jgi:GTPase SAR1 family protein
MNNSVSTMSGKTKIKIVLLGNQSVGKSCIIEKYVKNHFDETANVHYQHNKAHRWYRFPGKKCYIS